MTDKLIEQIKADREAEEKAKGWEEKYRHQSTIDTSHLPEIEIDPNIERQIRRMGRLDKIESRILADAEALKAADELERLLRRYFTETPLGHQPHMIDEDTQKALAAYSEKRGERE